MKYKKIHQITSHALRSLTPSSVEILSYDKEERIARARIISDSFLNMPSMVRRFELLANLTSDDVRAKKITFIFQAWTPDEFALAMSGEDNLKQASEVLVGVLGVHNKTMLAGLLGVTERSLQDWEKKPIGELTPKAKRLTLLYQLAQYIEKHFSHVPQKMYREILENSRVVIDPNDEEGGSVSLMNMVISDPDEKYWPQIAKSAIADYLNEVGDEVLEAVEDEPVLFTRRDGQSFVLMSEQIYDEFRNEIQSLQRRLIGMSEIIDGKTTPFVLGEDRLKRFKGLEAALTELKKAAHDKLMETATKVEGVCVRPKRNLTE